VYSYLNNAASSWPKPESVISAIADSLQSIPSSEHRSNAAGTDDDCISGLREALLRFFNARENDVLILTSGGTEAINLAIKGLLQPDSHIITSAADHNAVLRPLNHLRQSQNINISVVPADYSGWVDPEAVENAIRDDTLAVIISHLSNVTGTVQDVASVGHICGQCGAILIVDGCQSAGNIPVDFQSLDCDAFAFTGHKGLMGPPGTGGLLIKCSLAKKLEPLVHGGVGFDAQAPVFVEEIPERFEPGTYNYPGLKGLAAGIGWISENRGSSSARVTSLGRKLAIALEEIPGVALLGDKSDRWFPGIISFLVEGLEPAEIEGFLWENDKVICRSGYCCAPLIHDYLGSESSGVVRFSLGPFNTEENIETTINAMKGICKLAV